MAVKIAKDPLKEFMVYRFAPMEFSEMSGSESKSWLSRKLYISVTGKGAERNIQLVALNRFERFLRFFFGAFSNTHSKNVFDEDFGRNIIELKNEEKYKEKEDAYFYNFRVDQLATKFGIIRLKSKDPKIFSSKKPTEVLSEKEKELKEAIKSIEKDLAEMINTCSDLRPMEEQLNKKQEALKKAIGDIEEKISDKRKELNDLLKKNDYSDSEKTSQLESDIQAANKTIEDLRKNFESRNEKDIKDIKEKRAKLKENLSKIKELNVGSLLDLAITLTNPEFLNRVEKIKAATIQKELLKFEYYSAT